MTCECLNGSRVCKVYGVEQGQIRPKKTPEEWTDYGPFSNGRTLPFSRVKRLARGRVFAVE